MKQKQGQEKGKNTQKKENKDSDGFICLEAAMLWGSSCLGELGELTIGKPVRVEKK